MPPTADLVARERVADVRFGVYLTVREMELAARALGRSRTLSARTLAQRLSDKAHQLRGLTNADA
jgi:hypothetical protein